MELKDVEMPDGWFKLDGCDYDTAEGLIQTGLMGFCGCGDPETNLEYVREALEHIDSPRPEVFNDRDAWDAWYEDWKADEVRIFGNTQSAYFFFYWADANGLTEHGSSVPGWLTEKGRTVLALLREYELRASAGGEA